MKIDFRAEALADLTAIADYYVARANHELAGAIVREIYKAIELRTHPAFRRAARHNLKTDTYEIVLPRLPYIVVYRPEKAALDVIGVFHTARGSRPNREAI